MTLPHVLKKAGILLLDGATGSELMKRGLEPGVCPELWNLTHAGEVRDIARMYFDAGSDVVFTNTFGGSWLKLCDSGLGNDVHELNLAGARLACEARPAGRFVIGSVGPSGKMLAPFGDTEPEEMVRSFALQVAAIAEAGVDGFMLETFQDLDELSCAIKAIREVCDLPYSVSLTYSKTEGGFYTMMGTSLADAALSLASSGSLSIGSNCGSGMQQMIVVGRALRNLLPGIPLSVKPNAGDPVWLDGKTCYTEDAGAFETGFSELALLAPVMIGGCCGTGAGHIRLLRRLIDDWKEARRQ